MEFSCENFLEAYSHGAYQSLKFSAIPAVCVGLFGKVNTKNLGKLLQEYRIPQAEKIVAHLTKKFLFAVDGVLFTENAIYAKPGNCPEGISNRIPWSELHQYFLVQKSNTDAVSLYRPDGVQCVLLQSTVVDTTSGNELVYFISNMQSAILQEYPALLAKRKELFEVLKAECERIMTSDMLNDRLESALKHLLYERDFVGEAAVLMASNCARLYPQHEYQQWLQQSQESIWSEINEAVAELWEPIAEEFLERLERKDPGFSPSYLEKVYANYMHVEALTVLESRIQANLCERLKMWQDVESITERMYALGLNEAADDLYFSYFGDSNHEMRKIYQQLKEGNGTLSKQQLSLKDSMGLTAYHYALIIGNQKLISELLKSKRWTEAEWTFDEANIYDLFFLAVYKGVPEDSLKKALLRTDKAAIHLKRTLRSAQAENITGDILEGLLDASIKAADTMEKNGYCSLEPDEYQKMLLDKDTLSESSGERKGKVFLAEVALNTYLDETISEAKQQVSQWNKAKDPRVRYVLHLYSDPEYFEKMLFHTGEWTLYGDDNGWHGMAPSGEIKTHASPDEESSDVEKPFVDSWFSESAHQNAEILKKEFRDLAKKYHPDTSDIPESTELFQNISAEYEQLQDYLNSQNI